MNIISNIKAEALFKAEKDIRTEIRRWINLYEKNNIYNMNIISQIPKISGTFNLDKDYDTNEFIFYIDIYQKPRIDIYRGKMNNRLVIDVSSSFLNTIIDLLNKSNKVTEDIGIKNIHNYLLF